MTRWLIGIVLFGVSLSGFSQEYRVDQPLQTSGPNVPSTSGPLPQALWVANATVAICAHPSASYAACLATPITTYTDSTGTTPCPTTSQLVQLPGKTCTNSAGVTANVGFWYSGGLVDYYAATNYGTYGPYTVATLGSGDFLLLAGGTLTGYLNMLPGLSNCATNPGALNIQVPTGSGQSGGLPNQCVGEYSNIEADSVRTKVWGGNWTGICPYGGPNPCDLWGGEFDGINDVVNNTGQTIIADLASGGQYPLTYALRFFNVVNTGVMTNGFAMGPVTSAALSFYAPATVAYTLTQNVTGSGTAQTVTTSEPCTPAGGPEGAGGGMYVSIDTGASHEDVLIITTNCVSGYLSINGIFNNNHSSGASEYLYQGSQIIDASNIATRLYGWRVGNIQLQNASGSLAPVGFSVFDHSGNEQPYFFFLSSGGADTPVFRDLGAGWQFQRQASPNTVLFTLGDDGTFTALTQVKSPSVLGQQGVSTAALGTATSAQNYSSGAFTLPSSIWTGSAAVTCNGVWQNVAGSGTNASSSLIALAGGTCPGGAYLDLSNNSFSKILLPPTYQANGVTITQPSSSGTLALTSQISGSVFEVNGTPLTSSSTVNFQAGTNITLANPSAGNITVTASATAATAFSALTSATNTTAAMVVGTGASLGTSGSGAITATAVPFSGVGAATNTNALLVGTGGTLGPTGSGTITANAFSGSVPVANGGTAATTAAAALASLMGGPSAGTYAVTCSSSTNCSPSTSPAALTIATGTASLPTSLIASGACSSAVTVSASGVATTDVISATFNGDPTSTTGYAPSAAGSLYIYAYPTSGNVNFKICNNTSSGVTPGSATLNWRVSR